MRTAKGLGAERRRQGQRAAMQIRVFYWLLLYQAVSSISGWSDYGKVSPSLALWPLGLLPSAFHFAHVFGAMFVAGIALALALPRSYLARGSAAFSLLMFAAFTNSFGKINHGYHLWIFVAFLFCFLPRDWCLENIGRASREAMLVLFRGAQALVLCTYTLSGFWKLWHGIRQFAAGEAHIFEAEALPRLIADRLYQTGSHSPAGEWLVANPEYGAFLMMPVLFMMLGALPSMLLPRIQPLLAFGLIGFHLGTNFFMGISFSGNIMLLACLVVASPFSRSSGFRRKKAAASDKPLPPRARPATNLEAAMAGKEAAGLDNS
jgi:hypothetical protein